MNYRLIDAILDLMENHPALIEDFPLLLIRLGSGSSLNLTTMSNPSLAARLNKVLTCLEEIGVEQKRDTGEWYFESPPGSSSNELVLVKLVRAMMDQVGMTIDAVTGVAVATTSPPHESNTTEKAKTDSNTERLLQDQTRTLLRDFVSLGENMKTELRTLCTMVQDGESVAIDGLPDERLRTALAALFEACGLVLSEMELDEDDHEEEQLLGYALPVDSSTKEEALSRLQYVMAVCNAAVVKGPMPRPANYKNDVSQYDESSDDDGEGPQLFGAAVRRNAVLAAPIAESFDGHQADNGDSKREDWMVVPSSKFDIFSSVQKGQPKNQGPIDPNIQVEIDQIRNAYEEARGPSLLEEHKARKALEKAEKAVLDKEWKWNRDKDLDQGRRVDKNALKMMLGGAEQGLKSKFHSSR